MKLDQFCAWLDGYYARRAPADLTQEEWKVVLEKLATVPGNYNALFFMGGGKVSYASGSANTKQIDATAT